MLTSIRDDHIRFIEFPRKYYVRWRLDADEWSDDGCSATTLIKKYFHKFDAAQVIARMMANEARFQQSKYAGMSPKTIHQLWDQNGKEARQQGTEYHSAAEQLLLGHSPMTWTPELHQLQTWIETVLIPSNRVILRTEWPLFSSDSYKITGTPDFLTISHDHPIPSLCDSVLKIQIGDHKRCRQINTHGYGRHGIGPLAHLNDCNFEHYSLQASMYKWVLEHFYTNVTYNGHQYRQIQVTDLFLVVVHPDRRSFEHIQLADRSTEINTITAQRATALVEQIYGPYLCNS